MALSHSFWTDLLDLKLLDVEIQGDDSLDEYFNLRKTNNEIRSIVVEAMFDIFSEVALKITSKGIAVKIGERADAAFSFLGSTMRGDGMTFSSGVRRLSCEVGWIKAPGDGIIMGGGLAIARISHFGMPEKETFLRLVKSETSFVWHRHGSDGPSEPFDPAEIIRHFKILVE